jgi:surface carbohydrate biosynthesis protein
MTKQQLRIALIVDNPFRDLPALVLVATKLCERGAKCYLVPFNLQNKELQFLLPDFVLLNYQRVNSTELTNKLNSLGIKIGVLNTEGIFSPTPKYANTVLENDSNTIPSSDFDDFYIAMTKDEKAREAVDCYCCWNTDFADYIAQNKFYNTSSIYLTGLPRIDLLCPDLKNLSMGFVPEVKKIEKPLILITASFSLPAPKFQKEEEEIEMMVKYYNFKREFVLEWVSIEKEARDQYVALANTLSQRFPHIDFVYRPHPFENENFYYEKLLKNDNLHLIKKGTLDAWLHKSLALIHNKSCTTSLEAGIAHVPVLTANWVKYHKSYPFLDGITLGAPDINDMIQKVEELLKGNIAVNEKMKRQISTIHDKLFYKLLS